MRHSITLCLSATLLLSAAPSNAQGVFGRLKQAAKDKVSQTTGATVDKAEDAASAPTPSEPAPAQQATPAQDATPTPATPVTIKAYQNYDFTPGGTILFADDFTATQDGEFPDQWELIAGQGTVNKQQGHETFTLTDGNYVRVSPRLKTKTYLPTQFTIDFDTFPNNGDGDAIILLEQGDNEATISTGHSSVSYHAEGIDLSGNLPDAASGETYDNKWHHIAVAIKNGQMKVYVDQYRVLVVPDMKFTAQSLEFGGVASQDKPIIFTNVHLASGGGMNLIGQKFTDAKIVTHGINFDIDKAILRPESMGTLNQIKRIMTDNPDLKFEIDGHT
ncbi:MAG: hypothetical protein ABI072_06320, partial [Edaphobacter sp.]